MAVNVRLLGDWGEAKRVLRAGSLRTKRCIAQSLRQEGQFLRKQIVQGIRKQKPGGKAFKKLAPITLAIRRFQGFRGRKALIRSGDLVGSVAVVDRGLGVFIGVLKTARANDGRSLVNVAAIQEFGSRPITIRMTDKMRRFLFAALAASRVSPRGSSSGTGTGIIVISIPARPFLRPVFDKFAKPRVIGPRFMDRMAECFKGQMGTTGRRAPR